MDIILEYGNFFFIGLLGAVVANSTGSGGGVIFIPFFSALGLTHIQTLGTSILIQCFGMTAGSLSWLASMKNTSNPLGREFHLVKTILSIGIAPTIFGVLSAQFWVIEPVISMTAMFRIFSVVFGIALLVSALGPQKKDSARLSLQAYDQVALVAICFFGGMLVSWISIGVGEWVVVYLIFRRYPMMVAVCAGVCMSSVAVLSASFYHVFHLSSVVWEVIMFAAPAAVIGGVFAKYLAFQLGAGRLKIFFGAWILVTGLLMN